MKKLISFCIIAFVFLYVLATGFFIVKTSLTSNFSNAQLIAHFLTAKPPSFSTLAFAHLADAASSTGMLLQANPLSAYSFQTLPLLTSSTSEASNSYESILTAMTATLLQLEATSGSTPGSQ